MASMQARMDARSKTFKKNVDSEDTRRKREDEAVQLRKQKREEQMTKRRIFDPQEEEVGGENVPSVNPNVAAGGVPFIVQQLKEGNAEKFLPLTQDLRRLVARQNNPPLQEAVDAGVVEMMVHFLQMEDPSLQFEASWVLTNIASGESVQTKAVVDGGALPHFMRILQNGAPETQEQVVWALANIAGDSTKLRDTVLAMDPLTPMLELLVRHEGRLTMLQNITWAMSNFCRAKPAAPFSQIQKCIPYLDRLVRCSNHDVLSDSLWALSYLCDASPEATDAVVQSGALSRIVEIIGEPDGKLLQPALRAAGNVATGTEMQTSVLLAHNILNHIPALLARPKSTIRKETCWLISNITAGTSDQIQSVLDHSIFPRIMELVADGPMEVRKEAVWCLGNAAVGGTFGQLEMFTNLGMVQTLCESLTSNHDPATTNCALDAISAFLAAGEKRREQEGGLNIYNAVIEDCGGLTAIEHLQEDSNEDVYKKAMNLLGTYFESEEECDTPTGDAVPSQFNFA